MEWNMVRGRATRGSKGGVRESEAPGRVNENSVETSEDGWVLLIGPGELTIKQRDFEKPEIVDEVIEGSCFRSVEIVVRFVARSPKKVKIPHDSHTVGKGRVDLFERG
jgi:hypothetical protein